MASRKDGARSEEQKCVQQSQEDPFTLNGLALQTYVIFRFIFLLFYKINHLNECHVPEANSRVLYYHLNGCLYLEVRQYGDQNSARADGLNN